MNLIFQSIMRCFHMNSVLRSNLEKHSYVIDIEIKSSLVYWFIFESEKEGRSFIYSQLNKRGPFRPFGITINVFNTKNFQCFIFFSNIFSFFAGLSDMTFVGDNLRNGRIRRLLHYSTRLKAV